MAPTENLESLLAGMRREAREERERVLAEARVEARGILDQADARVAQIQEEARRRVEQRIRQAEERLQAQARLAESAARLAAVRAAMSRVFDLAGQQVRARAGSPSYRHALRKLLHQALDMVPGSVQVGVPEADAEAARELLSETGRAGEVVAIEGEPATVIISSADGLRSVDNGPLTRLSVAAETLEREVFLILTGSEPGP
jgi:vacuolar-type H+-ATPase subunit E/Vma4